MNGAGKMPEVAIAELENNGDGGFSPRGAAKALWKSKDHEIVIAGPAETGKTFAACHKLDALLWKYPGSQAVMARKTLASLYTSVYQTYRKVVNADSRDCKLRFYGGEKPEWVDYPNNSKLFLAGMDNPQKSLSSERDFVFINQLEEFQREEYEILVTRCTGRAANSPYPQLMSDCNPGPSNHWILRRPELKMLHSRHKDNPTLFDENGKITPRGERTMAILNSLTGVRKARLLSGKWVSAEGIVYEEFDRGIHVIPSNSEAHGLKNGIPDSWTRFCSIDFGFTNPFVCAWYAVDPDGRLYRYREIYKTQTLVSEHAKQIKRYSEKERISVTVADHDAEDRATLHACGVPTQKAFKSILRGIEAVQLRLQIAGDGKPRLFFVENSLIEEDANLAELSKPTCGIDEIEVYVWPKGIDGKSMKEVPVDNNNHAMDEVRYAVAYADKLGGGWATDPAHWAWVHEPA